MILVHNWAPFSLTYAVEYRRDVLVLAREAGHLRYHILVCCSVGRGAEEGNEEPVTEKERYENNPTEAAEEVSGIEMFSVLVGRFNCIYS